MCSLLDYEHFLCFWHKMLPRYVLSLRSPGKNCFYKISRCFSVGGSLETKMEMPNELITPEMSLFPDL